MTDSGRGYQQFFAELKRRHVFKVAAIYGAVAFGVLQVAEPLGSALGLSDSFLSLVVGLLLLGFPVALVLAWAFEVTPEGVQKAEPAAPGEIEAIVAQPASKRWPAGLLALAGAGLLFGGWWMGRTTAPATGEAVQANLISGLHLVDLADDARPSIAVLPFADMSSTQDHEYFSDGMTDEIINTLVGIRELRVAARTSAFAFKGQDLDVRAIGDSLNVSYLVEGSVRKAGDQLRITAQLIDAADGTHLWSHQYDDQLTAANMFRIQTEIATAIADAMKVPLGLGDASDLVTPTADLQAYDLYFAGRARLRERGESMPEAIRLFKAAIARDSTWSPAWAGLAEASEVSIWYNAYFEGRESMSEQDVAETVSALLNQAEAAARRALELDPNIAGAHVALGSVLRNRYEWADSESEYQKALQRDPENLEAHHQYTQLLDSTGRLREAQFMADRSIQLDRTPIRLFSRAEVLSHTGRPDAALAILDEIGELNPQLRSHMHPVEFQYLVAGGRWERLRERVVGDSTFGNPGPVIDALVGRRFGEVSWERFSAAFPSMPERAVQQAWAHVLMYAGQNDQAARQLREAYREAWLPGAIWMPKFDPIREHPAYLELLRELNLEGVTPDRPIQ